MGRVNKSIEGVFTDLVGGPNEISSYEIFLRDQPTNTKSNDLRGYIDNYKKIVNRNKNQFHKLAMLEEIIMQMTIREKMDEIKITRVRDYIYARCPFYRRKNTAKEIRVLVDNADLWQEDVDKLMYNKDFMNKAKSKLIAAMDKEIQSNIEIFKTKFKK